MAKVSIVVPSLNVKDYIGKCLDSLVAQTLKDIEIICVDAFSTDGTREIIKEYQQRDSRIQLLDDTEKSSGYADNLGFDHATGEYLGIVESDDYVKEDMMEILYSKAKANNLDYIKADYSMFVTIDGNEITVNAFDKLSRNKMGIADKVISPKDYPELLVLDSYMWKGIYKAEFIKNNNIRLNETKGAAYQDNGFLHQTICRAQRAMYIQDKFYQYRRDNEGASSYNIKGLSFMLQEYKFMDDFMYKNQEITKPFMNYYYLKMFYQLRGQLDKTARFCEYSEDVRALMKEFHDLFAKGWEKGNIRLDEFAYDMYEALIFLDDYNFYFMSQNKRLKAQELIYRTYLHKLRDKKNIIIASFGERGRSLYCFLKRNGVNNIVAICDNNKELWGMDIVNERICSFEETCKMFPEAYYVISNTRNNEQIKEQLLSLGIKEADIDIYKLEATAHFCTTLQF